jgi:hypothetical protein
LLPPKRLLSFPQFHRAHHNNKLYRYQKQPNGCCGDEAKDGCGKKALGFPWLSAGLEGLPIPMHFHRFCVFCGPL